MLPARRSMFPRALKGGDRLLHAALCGELGLEGTVRPLHFATWVVRSLATHMYCRTHARTNPYSASYLHHHVHVELWCTYVHSSTVASALRTSQGPA